MHQTTLCLRLVCGGANQAVISVYHITREPKHPYPCHLTPLHPDAACSAKVPGTKNTFRRSWWAVNGNKAAASYGKKKLKGKGVTTGFAVRVPSSMAWSEDTALCVHLLGTWPYAGRGQGGEAWVDWLAGRHACRPGQTGADFRPGDLPRPASPACFPRHIVKFAGPRRSTLLLLPPSTVLHAI